ncbi:MAG: EAL domain-containing protein [Sulfuricaulis sp.]|nr:EAL domain-containing protein [Sulfuricaulis sp.]
MVIQRLTMRASLSLTIVVMGLLGLGLALATGEAYRHQMLENQRAAMGGLLRLKTLDLLKDLEIKSRDLGLTIQHGAAFRSAFAGRDQINLVKQLNNQFHQYFATVDVVKLQKLQVFDLNFALVAESSEGAPALANKIIACPTLVDQARIRQGRFRLLPISQLCQFSGLPFHAQIVPIGGLRPTGYLQIVTDPTYSLAKIETALDMPLKITLVPGRVFYKSESWLPPDAMEHAIVAEYPLEVPSVGRVLTIAVMQDIHPLYQKLAMTRYMIMMAAGLVTLLVIAIALLALQNTTLRPLMALHEQLRSVRKDRTRLSESLTPTGTLEIKELAEDFNALSAELRDLHRMLERMAFTDTLTNLPNRSLFHERLQQCTAAVRAVQSPFALFVMDLDRFKEVNDSFGHDIGDQLLKQVSSRLNGVLRRTDVFVRLDNETANKIGNEIVARLGGDEFAAIVPGITDDKSAVLIAQKFTNAMQQSFSIGNHRFNIGVSIGIVLYPQHGADPMTLLRQADVAMYQAKQGKCGYAFFDSVRDHHKLQLLSLERYLRHAIETGNLELHFQPMVDIRTTKVSCVEALVRWRFPEMELTPPDRFIHIAEQCGLIQPLTRWVLNHAIEQCARWRKSGFPLDVAVNLSAMNLHEPDFVDYVMNTLLRWEVEPSWLSLEVTESAVMTDPDHALGVLSRLDTMGVRISIDDFGTGYSSLAYLKRLPVDEIKIDRSFVLDMKRDSNDAVIVRSTIDLAHNMSLRVVAEGVENPETLRLLTTLGCDIVQGFFVSRPLAYDDLIQWLGSSAWSAKQRPSVPASAKKGSPVVPLRLPHPDFPQAK